MLEGFTGENSTEVDYALANSYSLARQPEIAISHLSRALSADRGLAVMAVLDPDFKPLRDEKAFLEVLEAYIPPEDLRVTSVKVV